MIGMLGALVRAVSLGAASLLALSCTKAEEQATPWTAEPAAAASEPQAQSDARDQFALLDAIVAAKGNDTFADPGIMPRVRSEWIDRRYRWDVLLQPALCPAKGDCVVLPFDHSRREEPIAQGWLPRLSLSAEDRGALRERCAPFRQCVITFDGTLGQFELSNELPTSLTFNDVTVTAAREAGPGESWTVSKRRKRLNDRAREALARVQ